MPYNGLIEKYSKFLPVSSKTPIVSLKEGNTPLIRSGFLSEMTRCDVYLKYEGLNPTGSFKDRGMTMAISKAKEDGSKVVMCASTGNTSASAAAYSARAGLKCVVLIPSGAIALGKLAQALIHGAKVLAIKGNFDEALTLAREITEKFPITLVNSLNPYRIEGQKTGAFEICDCLGSAPEYHAIPVGNAGNITAYWKGYKEYKEAGLTASLPKMLGFQAAGAAPIVKGKPVIDPKTIATAIKIGNPASWQKASEARDESGGLIDSVTDKEILAAYKLLAIKDGVFVEPASAASVAGVLKLAKKGYFKKTGRIVCILTGHGLKDPDRAIASVKRPKILKPELKLILKEIGIK
ncbi:MAG: threonine synthase [Candidatus Omnitrophica bacterium CG1_02_44_16]|nr:MAG: threonine synthase [Candidatus Omnitrophica bacterium CG1_02_44_16]PIY82176.1 MAG: threonine synthase [Candidatus Omnitrophica bacterium CG_4_10_14_0_8_um_filter_44_12]PIZ83473.1 MAG: threonine synthase [Candidatus Omnitrophica bacterium CG_4_10_14_0_2_um_filter_44_9]